MIEVKKATQSAITVMIIIFLSKVLGFTRETLIALRYGAGYEADSYFIAITASMVMVTVVGEALNTTLIPVFTEIRHNEGKIHAVKFMNNILSAAILITAAITIFGCICSPIIMKVVAKGFEEEQFNLAVRLNRIGIPMIVFITCAFVFKGFLQSSDKFISSAFVGIPFNIVHIIFLIFLSGMFDITGLMIATVVAASTQVMIQLPSAYKAGFNYKFNLDIRDSHIRKVLLLTGPVILGSAVQQINIIVDRALASGLVVGSVSALNYAFILNSLVINVFVMGITTVIFPAISKESINCGYETLAKITDRVIKVIILFLFPVTAGFIVLAYPIVEFLFERGAFDSAATEMTGGALIFYSVGLLGYGLREVISKVFYALQDTRTPMLNGVLAAAVNVILNLILVRYMAHAGLALATSISAIATCILLYYSLHKRLNCPPSNNQIVFLAKSGLSAFAMGAAVFYINLWLNTYLIGQSLAVKGVRLGLTVFAGGVLYFLLCYLLKIEEVNVIINHIITKPIKDNISVVYVKRMLSQNDMGLIITAVTLSIFIGVISSTLGTVYFTCFLVLVSVAALFFVFFQLKDRVLTNMLFLSFFLKIALMVYQGFIGNLPFSGIDSVRFENWGWDLASSYQSCSEILRVDIDFYYRFIGTIYHFIGRFPLIILYINVVFGTLLALVVYSIIIELGGSVNNARSGAVFTVFFPILNIYSAVILRESIITFFTTLSTYFFLKWINNGRGWEAGKTLSSLLIASLFHSGVIFIGAIYVVYFTLYNPRSKKWGLSLKYTLAAVIIIVFLFSAYGGFFLRKTPDLTMDKILEISSHESSGRTTYLRNMKSTSIMDLLLHTPVRMIYFLFAPFPWQVRSVGDMVALFTDSVLYYILFFYLIKTLRQNRFENRLSVCSLLISIILITAVFSIGTYNFGTAIRHRQKLSGLLMGISFSGFEFEQIKTVSGKSKIKRAIAGVFKNESAPSDQNKQRGKVGLLANKGAEKLRC